MTLGPEFKHADLIAKHLTGRHNQLDHGHRVLQGLMRGLDAPKGPDHVDMAPERERTTQYRTRVMQPNDPLTKPLPKEPLREWITAQKIGSEVTIVARQKKGQQWVRIQANVAYLGWADQDHIKVGRLPYRPGDPVQRAPYRAVRPPQGIQKWFVPTRELTDLSKAAQAVDGDGDGWVYDGTPKKRPATPAEKAAGAALRRAGKAGPKNPDPKLNEYGRRLAQYEAAINAAKTDNDIEDILDAVEQDSLLNTKDYNGVIDALEAKHKNGQKADLLGPHLAGKKQVAPKKAAPAKKVAAKQVPAKKAPPKKAAAKKKGTLTAAWERNLAAEKAKHTPAKKQAGRVPVKAAAGKKAAPAKKAPLKNPRLAMSRRAAARDRQAQKIRDAAAQAPEFDLRRRGGNTESRLPHTQQSQMDRDAAMAGAPKGRTKDHAAMVIAYEKAMENANTALALAKLKTAVESDKILRPNAKKDLLDRINRKGLALDSIRRRQAAKKQAGAKKPGPVTRAHEKLREAGLDIPQKQESFGNIGRTQHGPKTNAWKQLAARDIKRARSARVLNGRSKQIDNLHAAGRISPSEVVEMKALVDQRRRELGLPAAPSQIKRKNDSKFGRWLARVGQQPNTPGRGQKGRVPGDTATPMSPGPATMQERAELGVQVEQYMKRIESAKDIAELNKIKADLQRDGLADVLRQDGVTDLRNKINSAYRAKKKSIMNPPTIKPRRPPGAGRAKAKAAGVPEVNNMSHKDLQKHADTVNGIGELEAMQVWLDSQKDMPQDQYDDIIERLDKQMTRIEQAERKREMNLGPSGADIEKGPDGTFEAYVAQRNHFAQGGGITDAPAVGLWNYLRSHEDRFHVEVNGKKGVSANFWVTDKQTNEKWMLKKSYFANDIVKENLANDLLGDAGFNRPTTRFAAAPGADVTFMAQRHYAQELEDDGTILKNSQHYSSRNGFKSLVPKLVKGTDRGAAARLLVFDYLINNAGDRHRENIMFVETKNGGVNIAIIDEGLAFGGGWGGPMPKHYSFDAFQGDYRGDDMGAGGAGVSILAWHIADGQEALLRQDLQEAIDGFSGVDFKALHQKYLDTRPPLTPAQLQDIEKWLGEMEWRLDWLKDKANLDRVVRGARRAADGR